MPGTWYTSDPHIHHKLMVTTRGFASLDEHDGTIIKRWNKVVAPEDTVWVLGDIGMGNAAAYLGMAACLNGTKHLVSGNHDEPWPGHRDAHKKQEAWLRVFATIQPFARRRIGGHDVLLSHFPYSGDHEDLYADRFVQYRLRDEGRWLLHGHTHGSERLHHGKQIHVGLDAWDLAPVNEGTICKLIAEADSKAA
jgi:calcineurin-like phosphoesterase family protein